VGDNIAIYLEMKDGASSAQQYDRFTSYMYSAELEQRIRVPDKDRSYIAVYRPPPRHHRVVVIVRRYKVSAFFSVIPSGDK